jgi:hypothetical protein
MVAGLTWWVWPKPKLRSCATREMTRPEQLASCSAPNQPISQQITNQHQTTRRRARPAELEAEHGIHTHRQQYFSLRTNQPPTIRQQYFSLRQQYFSLRTHQHRPSATRQTNRPFDQTDVFTCTSDQSDGNEHPMNAQSRFSCVL